MESRGLIWTKKYLLTKEESANFSNHIKIKDNYFNHDFDKNQIDYRTSGKHFFIIIGNYVDCRDIDIEK